MSDFKIIEEKNGIGLIEMDGWFYVVEIDRDRDQVKSAVPADCPDSGQYFATFTAKGIQYVAKGRKKPAARQYFNQLTQEDNS